MTIGPVQLIVLGFDRPDFGAALAAELERLRGNEALRLIDALALHKDLDGEFQVVELGTSEPGRVVGALVGLGIEGEAYPGHADGADGSEDGWDVLDDIPRDTAAALLLVEHRWAVPLREATARAGGHRIGDGFVSPLDLVGIGLLTPRESRRQHAIETGATEGEPVRERLAPP
jgi:hypothetical protein